MRRIFLVAVAAALVGSLGVAGRAGTDTMMGPAEMGILQPVTKVEGKVVVTTIKAKNGSYPSFSAIIQSRKAPRMAKLPCARLMIFMMPNMKDRPQATIA